MQSPKSTRERAIFALLVLSLILGGLVGLWALNRSTENDRQDAVEETAVIQEQKDEVEEAGALLAEQVLAACSASTDTAAELRAQGICPQAQEVQEVIEGPAGPPGPQGEAGEAGPPPSDAQVMRAVRAFCVDHPKACEGSDGRSVSAVQVATAIAVYCDARGQCRGPRGADGADGTDGQDAPPPTAEQIEAAVARYCGGDSCDGPAGPPGEDGTQVTSFVCEPIEGGVRLVLNFTDDPSQSVALRLTDAPGGLTCG